MKSCANYVFKYNFHFERIFFMKVEQNPYSELRILGTKWDYICILLKKKINIYIYLSGKRRWEDIKGGFLCICTRNETDFWKYKSLYNFMQSSSSILVTYSLPWKKQNKTKPDIDSFVVTWANITHPLLIT